MIKKIISSICAATLAITAFASLTVSAAEYTGFYLANGKTAAADGVQYFTVNKTDGVTDCLGGSIYIKATAGYFTPGGEAIVATDKIGLNNGKTIAALKKYQSYTCNVVADGSAKDPNPNDGYDVIAISWANSSAFVSEGDVLLEVLVVPTGEVAGDAELILYGDLFNTSSLGENKINVNKTYTFKAGTSTVTEKSAGKTVTVADTTNGTVTASATKDVAADTEVTLTVTPDAGYELDTILAKTATGTVEIVDNKFKMPAEDVTVTATFKKSTYTITLNSTAVGGSVAVDKTSAQMGDEVKVTATAADGYTFDSLTVEGVEGTVEGNVFTFTMPAKNVDLTATATFTKNVVPGTIADTDVKEGVDGFSKGFAAEFENIPEADITNVKWTLTKNGKSQSNTLDYNTAGVKGNVKFGLIVTLDENLFEGVSAAAELE